MGGEESGEAADGRGGGFGARFGPGETELKGFGFVLGVLGLGLGDFGPGDFFFGDEDFGEFLGGLEPGDGDEFFRFFNRISSCLLENSDVAMSSGNRFADFSSCTLPFSELDPCATKAANNIQKTKCLNNMLSEQITRKRKRNSSRVT